MPAARVCTQPIKIFNKFSKSTESSMQNEGTKYVPPALRRAGNFSNEGDVGGGVEFRDQSQQGGGGSYYRSGPQGFDYRGGGDFDAGGGYPQQGGYRGGGGGGRNSFYGGGGGGGYSRGYGGGDNYDRRFSSGGRGSGGYGGDGGGGGGGWFSGAYMGGTRKNELGFHGDMKPNPRIEQELFHTNDTQTAGINFDKYDNIPVEVSSGCPEPYTEFTAETVGSQLLKNLLLMKYLRPTPVQKYSIPIGKLIYFDTKSKDLFYNLEFNL